MRLHQLHSCPSQFKYNEYNIPSCPIKLILRCQFFLISKFTLYFFPRSLRDCLYCMHTVQNPMECHIMRHFISGSVFGLRSRGRWFEPHQRQCYVSLKKILYSLLRYNLSFSSQETSRHVCKILAGTIT